MIKAQLAEKYNLNMGTLNLYLQQVPGLERVNLKKASKFTPFEIQCIINNWGEPGPFINKKQLALTYEVSRNTLYNWLQLHNITFKYKLITPAEQQVIKSIFG